MILRPRIGLAAGVYLVRAAALHHAAHEACFIANSVLTEVVVEPG